MSDTVKQQSRAYSSVLDISPHLTVIAATVLSFLRTGYMPVDENNIYHVPILLRSFDLPQFADDAFIQSLRNFASGFWIVFSGAGNLVDAKLFLATWLVITHFAFLAAALHFARSLGFSDRRLLNIYLLILSLAGPLVGITVGGGGIMLHYFTHSELANAFVLFGFSYAIRGSHGHAAVATAITFFLNAFMAVWMILPLCFLAIYQIQTRMISFRALVVRGTAGSLLGAIFLLPPLINVFSNRQLLTVPSFSFRQFLWDFYPFHFFLHSNSGLHLANLLCAVAVIFVICRYLGSQMTPLRLLTGGMIAVLLIGTIIPLLTDSRMILNLHLIRSAVVVIFLFAIAAALLVAKWITAPENASSALFGWAICVALMPLQLGAVMVLVLLLFYRVLAAGALAPQGSASNGPRLFLCFAPIMAFFVFHNLYDHYSDQLRKVASEAQWERVGAWAEKALPAEATFMIMPDHNATGAALGFGYTSERRQIFAYKYGAAVLWSPAYFTVWDRNMTRREVLETPQDKLSYVAGSGADYLGTECDPALGNPVHQDGDSCLYAIASPVGQVR
ncbi:hypothetical protein [Rhizobium rhizogenes]|uniref:hypothetical protein n=1 Tax=Rhizobium rhizogenes TaxID=359 RepID=UPI001573E166|nr:hypothetical protein [Rhizobium rhizogenes]NTF41715.1 YfhO family protein [Rhizobium rhizogenes]